MPAYYSGTNCLATGIASTDNTPYEYVTDDWLYINGTLVKEDHGRTDHYSPANLSCIFDSTHFPDGSTITVRMEAVSNLGNRNFAENTAPVYNKGYVLVNQTLGSAAGDVGANVALTLITQANHSVTSASNHDKPTILANLPTYTVFFIYTHGSQAVFDDCFADGSDLVHYISSNEAGASVTTKTANQPPYAFAHFQACSVFANGDATMANALAVIYLTDINP